MSFTSSHARWRPEPGDLWYRKLLQAGILGLVIAALFIGIAGPVSAQFAGNMDVPGSSDPPPDEKPENPQAVDTQALAALILILENPTLRKNLLQFVKQQVPAETQPGSTAGKPGGTGAEQAAVDPTDLPGSSGEAQQPSLVNTVVNQVRSGFVDLVEFLDDAVALERLRKWFHVQSTSDELSNYWTDFLLGTIVTLIGAVAVYGFVIRLLRRLPALEPQSGEPSLKLRSRFLLMQLAVLAAAIVGYCVTAYLLFILTSVPGRTERVLLEILTTIGIGLVLCSLIRVVLCPYHPSMRLMQMSDEAALDLFIWLRRVILWITGGRAIFENIDGLQVPDSLFAGVERLWGLAAVIVSIMLVLRYRSDITDWITTDEGRFVLVRRFIARIWLPAYFVYVIGSYVIWALDIKGASILVAQGTLATFAVMFLVQPVALFLEHWLEKAENANFGTESLVIQQRLRLYARIAGRFAKAGVFILAAIAIAAAWRLDPLGQIGEHLSGPILSMVGEILLILAICVAIWETVDLSLSTYMDATDDETGTRIERSARTRTLVPLVRTIIIGFLLVAFAAATLNSLGLDIAPLLATAGIVGIAIGFGAQKLVQDVITGLFMLFQDTISVGDIVELGGISGTVQRLTIRTIELRDIEGNLHTIPFSSVSTVKNMTREFAFAVIDIGISYRENADHVMELLKHLGAELENDPVQGPNILAAIEVMGVQDLADSAVIIRCRFMVAPLTQFGVRRAFLGLVKRRFDEMGIDIPIPQRTLHWAQPYERPSFETGPLSAAAAGGKDT